jgi:putative glutamine amidotransferase
VTGTFSEIARCDGLVIAGGGDVHPKFYGKQEAVDIAKDVRIGRDLFEFDVIREAMERNIPTLGICRGAQVFNVAMGGTLIPDIESAGHPSHRKGDAIERLHHVRVAARSRLAGIVGVESGEVNTYHHQAVEKPGNGLRVAATSDDGIPEALEWEDPAGRPFVLLVQWHPERMGDTESPFARNIIECFAAEVRAAKIKEDSP